MSFGRCIPFIAIIFLVLSGRCSRAAESRGPGRRVTSIGKGPGDLFARVQRPLGDQAVVETARVASLTVKSNLASEIFTSTLTSKNKVLATQERRFVRHNWTTEKRKVTKKVTMVAPSEEQPVPLGPKAEQKELPVFPKGDLGTEPVGPTDLAPQPSPSRVEAQSTPKKLNRKQARFHTILNDLSSLRDLFDLPDAEKNEALRVDRDEPVFIRPIKRVMGIPKDITIMKGTLDGPSDQASAQPEKSSENSPEDAFNSPLILAEHRSLIKIPRRRKTVGPEESLAASTIQLAETSNISSSEHRRMGVDESPIKISWELGKIRSYLEKSNQSAKYAILKSILHKASAILRMYVRIPNKEKKIVVLSNTLCGFTFPSRKSSSAHLVMMADIFLPTDPTSTVIAKGKSCLRTTSNRTYLGVIRLNPKKLLDVGASRTNILKYVLTVVHETFHVLAFRQESFRALDQGEVPPTLQNLFQMTRDKPETSHKGHWLEHVLPNDIMIPTSRIDGIVSVFTLEMIDFVSQGYRTQRRHLPNNFFMEAVDDWKAYFGHSCSSNEAENSKKFNFLCKKEDAEAKKRYCSADYQYQTYCEANPRKNGCRYKVVDSRRSCVDPSLLSPEGKQPEPFEAYGAQARCFETSNQKAALCLQFQLTPQGVRVNAGGNTFECTRSGQTFDLVGRKEKKYSVVCPDLDEFKRVHRATNCPEQCNFNGFCSAGRCICFEGFTAESNCREEDGSAGRLTTFTESLK